MCVALVLFLFSAYCCPNQATNLLLIGDSVDRFITHDWCEFHGWRSGKAREVDWADSTLEIHDDYPKHRDKIPFLQCISPANDSIAMVHIFGSYAQGPYLKMNAPCKSKYCPTPARVERALELYFEKVGLPDFIIFHTIQWDAQKFIRRGADYNTIFSSEWNATLRDFGANLDLRLDEIQNITSRLYSCNSTFSSLPVPNIGLRTAVLNKAGGNLVNAMNDIYRKVAARRGLSLYDFDNDVWATLEWDYSKQSTVFRDYIHPVPVYLATAGEKMLFNRYSSYSFLRNVSDLDLARLPQVWLGPTNVSKRKQSVHLLRFSNTTFFSVSINANEEHDTRQHRRWGNVSREFLTHMHLGEGDIYNVKSETDLDLVHFAGNIALPALGSKPVYVRSNPNSTFQLVYSKIIVSSWPPFSNVVLCRRSVSLESAIKLNISLDRVQAVNEDWIKLTYSAPPL